MSEAHNQYMRDWKKRNRERVNEINRSVKAKNPDLYKRINRESASRMRADDPARVQRIQKKYRDANKKVCQKRTLDWAHNNPGIYLFYNAKGRSKKLGLPFDLERSDIVIPEVCPVLGIKIEVRHDGRKGFWNSSPSIDRLVPSKGYVKENIRIISNRANRLKNDATLDEVRAVLAYLERELAV